MDRIKAFGDRIKQLRADQRISQEALADLAGLDRAYLGGIERGERNPSLKNIFKIADALQASPLDLFK